MFFMNVELFSMTSTWRGIPDYRNCSLWSWRLGRQIPPDSWKAWVTHLNGWCLACFWGDRMESSCWLSCLAQITTSATWLHQGTWIGNLPTITEFSPFHSILHTPKRLCFQWETIATPKFITGLKKLVHHSHGIFHSVLGLRCSYLLTFVGLLYSVKLTISSLWLFSNNYLFWEAERNNLSWTDLLFVCHNSQVRDRFLELHLGVSHGGRGSSTWAVFFSILGELSGSWIRGEPNGTWTGTVIWDADIEL